MQRSFRSKMIIGVGGLKCPCCCPHGLHPGEYWKEVSGEIRRTGKKEILAQLHEMAEDEYLDLCFSGSPYTRDWHGCHDEDIDYWNDWKSSFLEEDYECFIKMLANNEWECYED